MFSENSILKSLYSKLKSETGDGMLLQIGNCQARHEIERGMKTHTIDVYTAGMKNGWYSVKRIKAIMPELRYSCVLVNRQNGMLVERMADNLGLFNLRVPVFVTDTHLDRYHDLAVAIARWTGNDMKEYSQAGRKYAAIGESKQVEETTKPKTIKKTRAKK